MYIDNTGPQLILVCVSDSQVQKVCGPLIESVPSTQDGPTQQSQTTQNSAVSDQSSTVKSVSSIPSLSPTAQDKSDEQHDSHVTMRKRYEIEFACMPLFKII